MLVLKLVNYLPVIAIISRNINLANKFKQKLDFVKDSNVTDTNGIAQYILKGDNIILKTRQNKTKKLQVYVEKG